MSDAPKRPKIDTVTSGAALRQWYWRKVELQAFARSLGLSATGVKFDILDRIAHFLDIGEKRSRKSLPKASKFDWHVEDLTDQTRITDTYRNTQNVRRYVKVALGADFKFNIAFMAWMKANVGKTLAEACIEYRAMQDRAAQPGFQTAIEPHNQFNQYTRDFLADNPGLGMADVRRAWARKIDQPSKSGRHIYDSSDVI